MSDEKNNRKASELTRLKLLWKKWPDSERQKVLGWREEEIEPGKLVTNAVIRERIKKYYQVVLVRDGQLSEFWSWSSAFMEELAFQEFMASRENTLTDQHPELTREQIRDALIKEWYALAKAKRDPKLGIAVAKLDLKDGEQQLNRDKFEFDAAKACLAKLPELKAISEKPKLTDEEKTKAIQEILFPK